jgi:hypothetical protein
MSALCVVALATASKKWSARANAHTAIRLRVHVQRLSRVYSRPSQAEIDERIARSQARKLEKLAQRVACPGDPRRLLRPRLPKPSYSQCDRLGDVTPCFLLRKAI